MPDGARLIVAWFAKTRPQLRLPSCLGLALLLSAAACTEDAQVVPLAHEKLSAYGFFEGELANLQPAEDLIPYDLNTPLFSDYAHKVRFVRLPPDSSAQYRAKGPFAFPVGTVLIKSFYYPADFRKRSGRRRIIETRLLVHTRSGWEPRNYRWNDEQTEAFRDKVGGSVPVQWIHTDGNNRSIQYRIPNQNQCKGCHNTRETIQPIGPWARRLNKVHPYPEGAENQLLHWRKQGILEGGPSPSEAPRAIPATDTTATLEARARAYLAINCAHCHKADGPASNSGLFLGPAVEAPAALGFCKRPSAAGKGTGGRHHVIVPGQPEASILVYRMQATEPDTRMPELGRTIAHEEGVALIRDWIAGMPAADCP